MDDLMEIVKMEGDEKVGKHRGDSSCYERDYEREIWWERG